MSNFKAREDFTPEQARLLWEEMGRPTDAVLANEIQARFGEDLKKPVGRTTIRSWRKNEWKPGDSRKGHQPSIGEILDGLSDAEKMKRTNREVGKAVAVAAVWFQKYGPVEMAKDLRVAGQFLVHLVKSNDTHVGTSERVPMASERQMKVVNETHADAAAAAPPANGSAAPVLMIEHDPLEDQKPVLQRALALVKG